MSSIILVTWKCFVVGFLLIGRWLLLNRKSVVFGKLVDGYEVLKKIEGAGDEDGRPAVTVKIINSGELHDGKTPSCSKPILLFIQKFSIYGDKSTSNL